MNEVENISNCAKCGKVLVNNEECNCHKNKIEEHFKNLTIDQFEKNILKAGLGKIQPSDKEMIVIDKS